MIGPSWARFLQDQYDLNHCSHSGCKHPLCCNCGKHQHEDFYAESGCIICEQRVKELKRWK